MRISLAGGKPEGDWASLNEFCGKGDGVKTKFETPFPAKEARAVHIMRDFGIISADAIKRVLDPDGKLLRDEPDGYTLSAPDPDQPVGIQFAQPPLTGVRVSCSALGRKPEKGEALKVLPMTDVLAKQLDEKLPPEFRKRNRDMNVTLPAVQDWNREAYNRLVVDAHGFTDDDGTPLDFTNTAVKGSILSLLGSIMLGSFAAERARALQNERQAGQKSELLD